MIRLYNLILEELGFTSFESANNGKEAIEKYKSLLNKPDITILDYRMPVMNGFEVMIEMLRADKSCKIILASADSSIKEQAISMGAIAFLNKPFNIPEFMNIIKRALITEQ
ncbi:hypothetical protein LCGC14_1344980 [marine sediment metagenome]|uniref:Response regulatory domain-containing protein n=1 Tax=marine sediment metagenome TaxID=412755 RepID=A0A0F9KD98_9ZZZZ